MQIKRTGQTTGAVPMCHILGAEKSVLYGFPNACHTKLFKVDDVKLLAKAEDFWLLSKSRKILEQLKSKTVNKYCLK